MCPEYYVKDVPGIYPYKLPRQDDYRTINWAKIIPYPEQMLLKIKELLQLQPNL